MNPSIEENKKLCERYPFLIIRNIWTDEIPKDYDYSYIGGISELPEGWHNLFLQMCEDIRQPLIDANYLDEFRFTEIKEKYGRMRCYNNGAPEKVAEIISNYEHVSNYVCQHCGKPATKRTTAWIENLCDDCYSKDPIKYEEIKFEPIRHMWTFRNSEPAKLEFDCSDIWDRLYK